MTGRGWAYAGAVLGGAVSIAANVAHSYVPPAGAAPGWRPQPGAVVGAVFWPTALLVAVEILSRTVWPAGRRWVAVRYAGLLPVAAVAAVVSYRHMSGLLAFYGEEPLTARIGPLAVDGLMVMAAGALLAAGRTAVAERDQDDDSAPVRVPSWPRPDRPPVTVREITPDRETAVSPEPAESHGLQLVKQADVSPPAEWPAACDCGCGKRVSRSTYWRHNSVGRMARPTGEEPA